MSLRNVAVPLELRDFIASEYAQAASVTIEAVAEAALQRQLAHVRDGHADGLAARYLVHPRLASAHGGATIRVRHDLLTEVDALALAMADELGRNVPRGRVLQALLWADLAPMTQAQRQEAALPPGSERINSNVPQSLYDGLRSLAVRRKTRDMGVTVDALLTQSLAAVTQSAAVRDELSTKLREQSTAEQGVMTIRYHRIHEAAIVRLARTQFEGVKSHALQALLWYALDQTHAVSDDLPDRQIAINGHLYAQIVERALAERATHGRIIPVREFVEQAITEKMGTYDQST